MKPFGLIALGLLIPIIVSAEDLPKRKPGLWEVTVASDRSPQQVMKQCTDENTDSQMMETGNSMADSMGVKCSKKELRKEGDTYISESECTFGSTVLKSKTEFSGNFDTEYSGHSASTYNPPLMGMTGNNTNIHARWLGACEPGQVPGDMVMSDGRKLNINALSKLGQFGARKSQ